MLKSNKTYKYFTLLRFLRMITEEKKIVGPGAKFTSTFLYMYVLLVEGITVHLHIFLAGDNVQ